MKTTPNWKPDINLSDKCGSCKHYEPYINNDLLTARGHCLIRNNSYRQRTDKCLKYERGEKMYKYFISYHYSCKEKGVGFGNAETHLKKKMENLKVVTEIGRQMEKDLGLIENSLVILNFIPLD